MDRVIDAVMIRIVPELGRTSTGHVDFHVVPSTEMGGLA
jgi:hypothetical protein